MPILVGAISAEQEKHFGQIIAPYLAAPDTIFVVSSDFCHWRVSLFLLHFLRSSVLKPSYIGVLAFHTHSTIHLRPIQPHPSKDSASLAIPHILKYPRHSRSMTVSKHSTEKPLIFLQSLLPLTPTTENEVQKRHMMTSPRISPGRRTRYADGILLAFYWVPWRRWKVRMMVRRRRTLHGLGWNGYVMPRAASASTSGTRALVMRAHTSWFSTRGLS